MHPVVFSPAWFERYQTVLLGLLRMPVIGRELRDVLAIRRHDVGYDGRIVQITPHSYTVANPDGTFTTDFRMHHKYAKRLRYQLNGLWQAAHAWDQYVANPLVPALNVGFDTLTTYPDPGDPGTTTVDGVVRRRGGDIGGISETFATLRAGAGTAASATSASDWAALLQATSTTDQFDDLRRGIYTFDTSALAGATVTTASFALCDTGGGGVGATTLEVCGASPASATTLVASDYGNVSRTSFASFTDAGWSSNVYHVGTLNASGIAALALGGVSKFSTQLEWDRSGTFSGTWSSGTLWLWGAVFADQTGSANDPKLEVTYSAGGCLVTLLGTT